jgi:hypothetical protein
LPALALIAIPLSNTFLFGSADPLLQVALAYVGLALAGTNLPATIVISEVFLLQENALFFYTETIAGHTVYLFSPWMVYVLFYTLLSLLLFVAAVRRVRKIPEK